jgi:hypothetical protein
VAALSSYLRDGGSDGDLHWYTFIQDKALMNLMYFNTSTLWASQDGWGSDGMTLVESRLVTSVIDWDFHEAARYGDNRFEFETWNHNRDGNELGFLDGFGRYGGENWHDW